MNIEIHMLQNFSPSNLNRDDTGNPKDTEFGGVRRARISSQCIKRAIRNAPVFAKITEVESGVRTRWMNRLLCEKFTNAGKDEIQAQAVANAAALQYSKMDKGHTSVLIFLSSREIQAISEQILQKWNEIVAELKDNKSPLIDTIAKDLFKQIKDRTGAPDIALFGRMLAEKPDLNIDAACQVAHAISTHRVSMEMDFYTAVDELAKDDETGAGMMGVTGFNSACFYRYACINWDLLVKNLDGDTKLAARTVEGFLRASISAVPTGKQNSFAAQNPPDLLFGVVRKDGSAWSLANAFEKPVKAGREGGYLLPSIEALDAYWGRLTAAYGHEGLLPVSLCLVEDACLANLQNTLVGDCDEWVEKILSGLE